MTTKSFKNPGDKELSGIVFGLMDKYPTMTAKALRNYIENNKGWRVGTQQIAFHRTSWLAKRREREADEQLQQLTKSGVIKPARVDVQVQGIEAYQKVVIGRDLRDPVEKQQKRAEDWALEHPHGTLAEMDEAIGKLIPDLAPQFAQAALDLAREAIAPKEVPQEVVAVTTPHLEQVPVPEKDRKRHGRGYLRLDRDQFVQQVLQERPDLIPTASEFGRDLPNVEPLRKLIIQRGWRTDGEKNNLLTTPDVKASLRRLHRRGLLPERRRVPVVSTPEELVAEVEKQPNWGTDRDAAGHPPQREVKLDVTVGITITLPDGTKVAGLSAAEAAVLLQGLKR